MDVRKELTEMTGTGYISFKIKYNNTEHNRLTHDAFKDFAKTVTDNNYLLALKVLLETYADDYRYEILDEKIRQLEAQLVEIQSAKVEKKEEKQNGKFF